MSISISSDLTSNANTNQYSSLNLADVENPWNVPEYLFVYAYYNPWLDYDDDGVANGLEIEWFKTNPFDEDSDGDGMGDLYEIYCGTILGGWQDPVVYNERYAVLIVGGRNLASNNPRYWNELVRMYDTLVEGYNYNPANIYVFWADSDLSDEDNIKNPRPSDAYYMPNEYIIPGSIETHLDMIDDEASWIRIIDTLYNLQELITLDDSLFVWVYDHGTHGGSYDQNAYIEL